MLLTIKETAGRLRVDVDTVYGWLREGKLRGAHLGGRRSWSIDEVDIEAFIAEAKNGHEAGRKSHGKPRKLAAKNGGQNAEEHFNQHWQRRYGQRA